MPNPTRVMLTLLALGAASPALAADPSVEDFEAAQAAAWNAHDASAYTAAMDDDVQVISALGWRWTGKAEAARNIGDGFQYIYAHAGMRIADVATRAVAPDLVAVTLAWTIDGARTLTPGPAGDAPAGEQRGLETQLLRRGGAAGGGAGGGAGWTIVAQQDTATLSAQPSPTPASATAAAPLAPPPTAYPTTPPPARRCVLGRANGDCLIYGKAKQPRK